MTDVATLGTSSEHHRSPTLPSSAESEVGAWRIISVYRRAKELSPDSHDRPSDPLNCRQCKACWEKEELEDGMFLAGKVGMGEGASRQWAAGGIPGHIRS